MKSALLLDEIKQQQALSNQIASLVLDALMDIYYPGLLPKNINFGEIGSYGRGTNNDPEPDIDVMYLGIPNDPDQGFTDWIGKGTYQITKTREGIKDLSQVGEYDPKLMQAILKTTAKIGHYFDCQGQAKFIYVRSWEDFPGVVFNVAAPTSGYGQLAFDINLYHELDYFGLEHTKRFISYFEHVRSVLGDRRAAQLILDVRQVKQAAKNYAKNPETGKFDRQKKVTGIIFETLFTHIFPPQTKSELAKQIRNQNLNAFPQALPNSDWMFPKQVIYQNFSLKEVLDFAWTCGLLHESNWDTVLKAFER